MNDQQHIRVLIIEDDEGDAALLCRLLADAQSIYVDTERAARFSSAVEFLKKKEFDLVLTDLGLPDSQGIGTFMKIHEIYPEVPVIVLTGFDDEETAVTAVQRGAQDYLIKGRIDADALIRSMRYAMERQKLLTALEKSLREIKTLRGFIPVCAWCRKIRDDDGYWKRLEVYLEGHLDISVTHGICPSCLKKTYPDLYEELKSKSPELWDEDKMK